MRKYDESSVAYSSGAGAQSDSIEAGRRVAIEKELESTPEALLTANAVFDESGNFLIYGSIGGVKVLNLVTNRVVRTLGAGEPGERFLSVALYQGIPKVDTQYLLSQGKQAMTSTVEEMTSEAPKGDPTIFCCSFKRRRFYCFSRRPPDESIESRDVLNEKPSEDERLSASAGSIEFFSFYFYFLHVFIIYYFLQALSACRQRWSCALTWVT